MAESGPKKASAPKPRIRVRADTNEVTNVAKDTHVANKDNEEDRVMGFEPIKKKTKSEAAASATTPVVVEASAPPLVPDMSLAPDTKKIEAWDKDMLSRLSPAELDSKIKAQEGDLYVGATAPAANPAAWDKESLSKLSPTELDSKIKAQEGVMAAMETNATPAAPNPEAWNQERLAKLSPEELDRHIVERERAATPSAPNPEAWNKEWFSKMSPEDLNRHIKDREKGLYDEAEKKNIGARGMETMRNCANWYKKQPFWKKMLVGAGLFGVGTAGALTGGTVGSCMLAAAFTGKVLQKGLASIGAFAAVEALSRKYTKSASPEKQFTFDRHMLAGAGAALLVLAMPSIMGQVGSYAKDSGVIDYLSPKLSMAGEFMKHHFMNMTANASTVITGEFVTPDGPSGPVVSETAAPTPTRPSAMNVIRERLASIIKPEATLPVPPIPPEVPASVSAAALTDRFDVPADSPAPAPAAPAPTNAPAPAPAAPDPTKAPAAPTAAESLKNPSPSGARAPVESMSLKNPAPTLAGGVAEVSPAASMVDKVTVPQGGNLITALRSSLPPGLSRETQEKIIEAIREGLVDEKNDAYNPNIDDYDVIPAGDITIPPGVRAEAYNKVLGLPVPPEFAPPPPTAPTGPTISLKNPAPILSGTPGHVLSEMPSPEQLMTKPGHVLSEMPSSEQQMSQTLGELGMNPGAEDQAPPRTFTAEDYQKSHGMSGPNAAGLNADAMNPDYFRKPVLPQTSGELGMNPGAEDQRPHLGGTSDYAMDPATLVNPPIESQELGMNPGAEDQAPRPEVGLDKNPSAVEQKSEIENATAYQEPEINRASTPPIPTPETPSPISYPTDLETSDFMRDRLKTPGGIFSFFQGDQTGAALDAWKGVQDLKAEDFLHPDDRGVQPIEVDGLSPRMQDLLKNDLSVVMNTLPTDVDKESMTIANAIKEGVARGILKN